MKVKLEAAERLAVLIDEVCSLAVTVEHGVDIDDEKFAITHNEAKKAVFHALRDTIVPVPVDEPEVEDVGCTYCEDGWCDPYGCGYQIPCPCREVFNVSCASCPFKSDQR